MNHRMPCSITDGPQYDDEPPPEPEDGDEGYDRMRQDEIDDQPLTSQVEGRRE